MRGIKKFEVLKAITDEKKFSELIFDLLTECDTSEKLTALLEEDISEEELQTISSIAQRGYPLSFERRQ